MKFQWTIESTSYRSQYRYRASLYLVSEDKLVAYDYFDWKWFAMRWLKRRAKQHVKDMTRHQKTVEGVFEIGEE